MKLPPRRKPPIAVGEVLFDSKGHGYRVISRDEAPGSDDVRLTALQIVPIEDDSGHEAEGLTARQRQIARLLANRATNAEIAAALGISVHTARHHSQRVLEKLGITSRSQVRTQLEGKSARELQGVGPPRREQ